MMSEFWLLFSRQAKDVVKGVKKRIGSRNPNFNFERIHSFRSKIWHFHLHHGKLSTMTSVPLHQAQHTGSPFSTQMHQTQIAFTHSQQYPQMPQTGQPVNNNSPYPQMPQTGSVVTNGHPYPQMPQTASGMYMQQPMPNQAHQAVEQGYPSQQQQQQMMMAQYYAQQQQQHAYGNQMGGYGYG
ncbi:hypothetical protein Bca101_053318 [Brassica carinata]